MLPKNGTPLHFPSPPPLPLPASSNQPLSHGWGGGGGVGVGWGGCIGKMIYDVVSCQNGLLANAPCLHRGPQGHGVVVVVSVKEDRKIVAFSCTLTEEARTSRSLADTVYFLLSLLSPLPDSSPHSFLPLFIILASFLPSFPRGRMVGFTECENGTEEPWLHGMRKWDRGTLAARDARMGQWRPGNVRVEPWLHGMREWDSGALVM